MVYLFCVDGSGKDYHMYFPHSGDPRSGTEIQVETTRETATTPKGTGRTLSVCKSFLWRCLGCARSEKLGVSLVPARLGICMSYPRIALTQRRMTNGMPLDLRQTVRY